MKTTRRITVTEETTTALSFGSHYDFHCPVCGFEVAKRSVSRVLTDLSDTGDALKPDGSALRKEHKSATLCMNDLEENL